MSKSLFPFFARVYKSTFSIRFKINHSLHSLESLSSEKFIEAKNNFFLPISRSPLRRYIFSFMVTGLSALLAYGLYDYPDIKILLFFAAVILSSWYGGNGPAILSTITLFCFEILFAIKHDIKIGFVFSSRLFVFTIISLLIGYLITVKKNYDAKLYTMALHDPLTGLPNRRLVEEKLEFVLGRAKRNTEIVGVMFLDLDKFKKINDTFGHEIGDKLLQEVGERLKMCVRKEDCVGRIGGDEFVLILVDIQTKQDVKVIAQKILSVFESPFIFEGHFLETSPSIGISLYPEDGASSTDLFRAADRALYIVKELSRNNYLLFNEMSK